MAKIKYYENVYVAPEELYRVETGYRLSGGFNLEITGLPAGAVIPPLAPLSVDMATRKATLVRRVRVLENGSAAKTLKVSKFGLITPGMYLSNSAQTREVESVDTTNSDYDLITAKADTSAFKATAILHEVSAASGVTAPKAKANYLNYAVTKVEAGATVTALAQAYEVQTDKLYIPVTLADKQELTNRFLFV